MTETQCPYCDNENCNWVGINRSNRDDYHGRPATEEDCDGGWDDDDEPTKHTATLTLLFNQDLRTKEHLPIGKVTITVEYDAPEMPNDWAQSVVADGLAGLVDEIHDHVLNHDWAWMNIRLSGAKE